MPDFDKLHEHAQKLANLTKPGQQEPGLSTWCMWVGETWKEIVRMWEADPKREASEDLYEALHGIMNRRDITSELLFKYSPLWEKARAALAKARGEQQTAATIAPPPELQKALEQAIGSFAESHPDFSQVAEVWREVLAKARGEQQPKPICVVCLDLKGSNDPDAVKCTTCGRWVKLEGELFTPDRRPTDPQGLQDRKRDAGNYYPPFTTTVPHAFQGQDRFCAKCGGGKLHIVHQTSEGEPDAGK